MIQNDKIIDWDHIYLLGWMDSNCKSYLTSWQGDLPYVDVVVLSTNWQGPPLWNAPIHKEKLEPMIDSAKTWAEKVEYATKMGGVYAFGWYFEKGNIERRKNDTK